MLGNIDGNIFEIEKILAKIHHDCNHYTTIEIFVIVFLNDGKYSQISSSLQYLTNMGEGDC